MSTNTTCHRACVSSESGPWRETLLIRSGEELAAVVAVVDVVVADYIFLFIYYFFLVRIFPCLARIGIDLD